MMTEPMTPDERAHLIEELQSLDTAMAGLEAARKPFDEAISALYEAKEFLLEKHHADIAGRCETCMDPIFVGDLGHHDGEHFFCEDCSPTWADTQEHAITSASEDWEDPDGRARCLAAIDAHIARGGTMLDKHIWEL